MVKDDIIEIVPHVDVSFTCVKCGKEDVEVLGTHFTGIHVLALCFCKSCDVGFFATLPIAHEARTPVAFTTSRDYVRYDANATIWLALPLINSMTRPGHSINPAINKKNLIPLKKEVIILNCLDDCFGHSFAKLLNATALLQRYPEKSLVLIITPNIEWMVPEGISELWIVKARMRLVRNKISTLQDFFTQQVEDVPNVYLSTANVYHKLHEIDMEPFLKTKPFDLSKSKDLPRTITFPLREDRFWHSNRFDELLNLAFVKFKIIKYFRWYFIMKQNRRVQKTIDLLPGVQVNITGIGKPGGFSKQVNDLRTTAVTPEVEKQWCDVYSRSHSIIGVHGSNMMVPTALAASFIELLPKYKIPFKGEDTVTLRGQHLDLFSSLRVVAQSIKQYL